VIGTHAVTLTPAAGGAAADISCLVDRVAIRHGRDDTNTQPEPNSATVDISLDTDIDPYPPGLDVGGMIHVTTTIPGHPAFVRFHGKITDVTQSWEENAGTETPSRQIAQVIAVGPLADIGRRIVGDTPWAQQLDGARVAAVMAAAGVILDPLFSDPGTVQIIARDVDSQPALDVAQQTAQDAGGTVWATRAGEIRYADAEHRRGTTAALSLDACDVLVSPKWSRTTAGLVNKVSIGYGVTADGSEQPRYVAQRDDSIGAYGRYEFETATQLAALADATAMGQLLLTANRVPVWIMSSLPVDVDGLSVDDYAALLGLEMHSLIALTGLPAANGAPTSAYLWVEGYTENLENGVHELELAVSGYCRTAPPPHWDNVPPDKTWDTIGAMTWDDASCLGLTPNLGRWNDVPASTRWDQLPPAATWDTWEGN
jgi:hypothetical protein